MPRIGSTAQIAELERRVDPAKRYMDLAVRFRVMNDDATPGRLLPRVVGGVWDTWLGCWAPQPPREEMLERAVEWSIQEQQIPIIFGVNSDVLHVAIFAGRQAGKTYASVMQVVLDAVRWPHRQSAIVSLDFKASRDPERTFRSLIPRHWKVTRQQPRTATDGAGPPGHNKTDRAYTFPNGHVVVFRSRENIDSVRGPSLKTVLMDEASRMKAEDLTTAEGCGAASKAFRIYLATTPKRESAWIREVDREWDKPERTLAKVIRLQTRNNPRRNQALLDELEANTPHDLFQQEFEGKIVAPEHAVWYLFERALHARKPGELPPAMQVGLEPIEVKGAPPRYTRDYTREFTQHRFQKAADHIIGWDFGKEAAVIAKVFRETRVVLGADGKIRRAYKDRLFIVGEAVNYRTTTEHHALEVANEWGTSAVVITDAMGDHERSEGRGASPASIKILREAGFARVTAVGPKNPDRENSIRAVLRLMKNVRGDVQMFVDDEECPTLVDALENQERNLMGEVIEDGKREHVIDALRYLVWLCFPVRREDAPRTPALRPKAA